MKKFKTIYTVEQGTFIFKTTKIDDIFKFFKDPTEHYSQCIMMDSMLPSKKRKRMRKVRV